MTTIKLRRGTTAQWQAANPILAVGEPAFDITTGLLRVGDGTSHWAELPTFLDEGALNNSIVKRDAVPQVGLDWSISDPGFLQFSPHFVPAGEAGEHIGVVCVWNGTRYRIQMCYAKGNLARVFYRTSSSTCPATTPTTRFCCVSRTGT